MARCVTDHFHVHIVALENEGYVGLSVGKAHLLTDLISLVSSMYNAQVFSSLRILLYQLSLSDDSGPSLLQKMTFAYTLGQEAGLFRAYKEAKAIA